jgi:hypothetical protein
MDAQVNGMVTVGSLFIYYCWTVVVAVTAHAMHGVNKVLASGPTQVQDTKLPSYTFLSKLRLS